MVVMVVVVVVVVVMAVAMAVAVVVVVVVVVGLIKEYILKAMVAVSLTQTPGFHV